MGYLFDTTDPRGNRVVLDEDQWEEHVLYGDHPEMAHKENLVRTAVESPDFIFQSDLVSTRQVYFRCDSSSPPLVCTTKVVVEYKETPAEVVTTWRQKGVSGGIADLIYEKDKV